MKKMKRSTAFRPLYRTKFFEANNPTSLFQSYEGLYSPFISRLKNLGIFRRSRITVILICASPLIAFNGDFQKRFGSNSALYNEPLYFSQWNIDTRDKRPRRSYREQIRKRISQQDTKKNK